MAWATIRITVDGLPEGWERDSAKRGDIWLAADDAATRVQDQLRKTGYAEVTTIAEAEDFD